MNRSKARQETKTDISMFQKKGLTVFKIYFKYRFEV